MQYMKILIIEQLIKFHRLQRRMLTRQLSVGMSKSIIAYRQRP